MDDQAKSVARALDFDSQIAQEIGGLQKETHSREFRTGSGKKQGSRRGGWRQSRKRSKRARVLRKAGACTKILATMGQNTAVLRRSTLQGFTPTQLKLIRADAAMAVSGWDKVWTLPAQCQEVISFATHTQAGHNASGGQRTHAEVGKIETSLDMLHRCSGHNSWRGSDGARDRRAT